ncbi:unnamed protein product [Spirodela intermedia]|uniref:Uncharacterized protein n=1 Tax=Spirodela intermedia TaxID=51605 RepID=A0A7I8IEA7_SPIIN|nr:unnamed protein product [Spirodela intermedia]CAA6655961.1 unnamed protein product [Spirodela intermedia]
MGGIWSTRLKKAEGGLSSSNTLGKGYGVGFAVHDRKIAKAYYDSMELRPTPGKDGASTAPQMTSILGRAGTVGLEKAVEVLDTIGSSMSNLTSASGFMSERVSRGNKICILSFEVANTITKGAALMRSVSQENLEFLKNKILLSDGIQKLVSMDMKELLAIVASDTREELDGFCKEVIRFGNLCKDPEWHNLARYFQKLFSDSSPPQLQKEDAEATMQHLTNLAQHTSDLYHEFHALDRFEQDYRSKLREEETLTAAQRGEHTMILQSELKRQRKLVKSLKKRSLWSRNLEEVMEKLVDIVAFIHQEILEGFGPTGINTANSREDPAPPRLGPSGLALHYANVIQQMDSIVSRPLSLPPNMRDSLYQGLPVSVKADLRSRLQTFRVKNEMTVAHIKAGMQKTLQWLVPMAESTVKAHQGFGWIGEWANMGADLNVKPCQCRSLIRIQTLHHADKEKLTSAYSS